MTTTPSTQKILWRPNNYRRQIQVKTKTNSGVETILTTIPLSMRKNTTYNDHTKLLFIKNYQPNITIQYGKNTLTGIFSQNIIHGKKETYLIETKTFKQCQNLLDKKRDEIKTRIDKALIDFAKTFKIYIPVCSPKWDRYEDWVKGEDYIDQIPKETIIHDTYFKKVYGDGIEFKSSQNQKEPVVLMKNYIKNRAVEDISPQIADEINHMHTSLAEELNPTITKLTPAIKALTEQITLHLAVEKRKLDNEIEMNHLLKDLKHHLPRQSTLESLKMRITTHNDIFKYKKDIDKLSDNDKHELSEWLFKRKAGR